MLVTSDKYRGEADYLGIHNLIADNYSLPQHQLYPSIAAGLFQVDERKSRSTNLSLDVV
jgi:hypothetical protein